MKLKLTVLALSLGLSAFTAAAQMVDLGPDAKSYRRFLLYPHLEKGFDAMAQGNRVRALAEFEQARTLAPNNPMVAIHLAEAYRHFGEPARAEAVLREQLTRNPNDAGLSKAVGALRSATQSSLLLATPAQPFSPAAVVRKPASRPVADSAGSAFEPVATSSQKAGAAQVRRSSTLRSKSRPRIADSAYVFADRAYKASARGNHADAANAARQALRLAPANRAYRSLLVYELMATDQLDEAEAVASQAPAVASAAGVDDELTARQKLVRQHIAFRHFDAANQAMSAGNPDAAVDSARKGIRYAPGLLAHRLQLIGVLQAAQQWPEAEQATADAMRDLGPQPALLVLRAYGLQRTGQRPAAATDLDAALAGAGLNAEDQRNFRLLAADAAMAAAEPEKVLDLLAAASATDEGVASRRAAAIKSYRQNSVARGATALAWPTPRMVCGGASFSPTCELRPGENPPDPAFPVADAAYKAFNARDYELAASKAREALVLAPGNLQYRALLVNTLTASGQLEPADQAASGFLASTPEDSEMLALRSNVRQRMGQPALAAADAEAALRSKTLSVATEIGMLQQLNRKAEARQRFTAALQDKSFDDQPDVDTAYLAVRVGDDETALAAFDRAFSAQTLPDPALQDAAYVAGRLGRNEASVDYFKHAIDAVEAGRLPLVPQQLFEARRSVADRSRNAGVYGSLTYRGIASSGLSLTPGGTNDTLQAGLEAYWRPFGYGNGRLFELYGGLAGTLYSKAGLTTGAPTVQGALGARVKPLVDANLVLALERRLAIGSQAQTDWLARIGYSWDKGLDLRVDAPAWWTGQIYAEAGRFIKLKQTYATFEAQAGRSFRLDQIHPKLVIFPHLVLGADRNDGYGKGKENAVGAGVGTSLRYWFNEDKYTAPRSYWDVSLQYRGRISGDERAKGTFLRFTLSY